MYEEYKPNEVIVDRAVELWIDMLKYPKYDNLGPNSPESTYSKHVNGMASMLATRAPKNNTPEVLEAFGRELKAILIGPFEWSNGSNRYVDTVNELHVDYQPDIYLDTAAKRSGLKMEFPWKTNIRLYNDSLSLSYGYGAETVYHYPLLNNKWLITTLSGSDIVKIKSLIERKIITLELRPYVQ